jgi:GT2 family glycosyltransferase
MFMQADKPFISIITINFRQPEATLEFLNSLRSIQYSNFEIIVCDVAAEAGNQDPFIALNLPHLRILPIQNNIGFGGANNLAAKASGGDYLLFINNDTIVTPSLLDSLIEPLLTNGSIGICCPKIRSYYNRSQIEYAGFKPMNMYTARTGSVGFGETDAGQHDTPGITSGAHGCAMMMKKSLFLEIGGFFEPYFLYYEDWDLSIRVRKLGYKIWYQATALVYHKGSITTGANSIQQTYYHTRNRILFVRRNANNVQRTMFNVFFVLFAMPKTLLEFIVTIRFKHIIPFLKAVQWNVKDRKRI